MAEKVTVNLKCTKCGFEESKEILGSQLAEGPKGWTSYWVSNHKPRKANICPSCTKIIAAWLGMVKKDEKEQPYISPDKEKRIEKAYWELPCDGVTDAIPEPESVNVIDVKGDTVQTIPAGKTELVPKG